MDKIKVQLDWDSANYFPLNGFHPLFEFLQSDNFSKRDIEFVNFSLKQKTYKYKDFDDSFQTKLTEIREQNQNNRAFETV